MKKTIDFKINKRLNYVPLIKHLTYRIIKEIKKLTCYKKCRKNGKPTLNIVNYCIHNILQCYHEIYLRKTVESLPNTRGKLDRNTLITWKFLGNARRLHLNVIQERLTSFFALENNLLLVCALDFRTIKVATRRVLHNVVKFIYML